MPRKMNKRGKDLLVEEAQLCLEKMVPELKDQAIDLDKEIILDDRLIPLKALHEFVVRRIKEAVSEESTHPSSFSDKPLTRQPAIDSSFLRRLHNHLPKVKPWQNRSWQEAALADFFENISENLKASR